MHTNYVLAPLDYNHFITGCQIIILFPHGFSGMQESVLTAACSAGALALRSSSAPIPGLADRGQAGWAAHRSLARGPGCCSRLLCSHLAAMGLRPVLGRSLPCLTCKTSFASRSREHQVKGVFSVLKQMEMVFRIQCAV